jgi:hypothetical protein
VTAPFLLYRETCNARLRSDVPRRPGNALNIEVGQPADRCIDKAPREWRGRGVSGFRWLASGGDAFVFGACSSACPRLCSHKDGEVCWWCKDGDAEECPHDRPYPAECPECKAAFIAGVDEAVRT